MYARVSSHSYFFQLAGNKVRLPISDPGSNSRANPESSLHRTLLP